jgi:hypothetical protein
MGIAAQPSDRGPTPTESPFGAIVVAAVPRAAAATERAIERCGDAPIRSDHPRHPHHPHHPHHPRHPHHPHHPHRPHARRSKPPSKSDDRADHDRVDHGHADAAPW